jgi:hypothetical protein
MKYLLNFVLFFLIGAHHVANVSADGPSSSNVVVTYTYLVEVESVGLPLSTAAVLEANALSLVQVFLNANPSYSYVQADTSYSTLSGIKYCPKTCKSTSSTKCKNLGCAVCRNCNRRRNVRGLLQATTTSAKLGPTKALTIESSIDALVAPYCNIKSYVLFDNDDGTVVRAATNTLWATKTGKELVVYTTPDQIIAATESISTTTTTTTTTTDTAGGFNV